MGTPTVTIALPVLNEEEHLGRCLDAIAAQTYDRVVEIIVVDGGSHDRTVTIAEATPLVRVLNNPGRTQSCGLNVALNAATGEVFVRIDGHCEVAEDYVERCVEALESTGAAIVGGAMTPTAAGTVQKSIAAAMSSPLGAGPAKFHDGSAAAGWVDTVYLGAFQTSLARTVGGYAEDVGVNEDAELAIRISRHGGVWFDPAIRSSYTPRTSVFAVVRQFYRYGRSRAATVRRHPHSLAPRQLVAPVLVLSLATPLRRKVLTAYVSLLLAWTVTGFRRRPLLTGAIVPAMHLPWGVGFLVGLILGPPAVPNTR